MREKTRDILSTMQRMAELFIRIGGIYLLALSVFVITLTNALGQTPTTTLGDSWIMCHVGLALGMAFLAWSRIVRLERRVAELEKLNKEEGRWSDGTQTREEVEQCDVGEDRGY